jgi:RNAse (barnase) inhibitor barstar
MSNSHAWWDTHLRGFTTRSVHVAADDPAELMAIRQASERLGFTLFSVNADQLSSKASLLDTLSQVMAFPAYFGRNWDALEECINDLSWWDSQGFILLFANTDKFINSSPGDFDKFVRIAADASESWGAEGIPFHVIFTGSARAAEATINALEGDACNHRLK